MIGFRMSIEGSKRMFFDREVVKSSMDKVTRLALSNFGAFVRTRAKTSMPKTKATSGPGQPPSQHLGLVSKLLYFVYEPTQQNVVIGPAMLNGKANNANTLETLERGGPIQILVGRGQGGYQRKSVNLEARPFMQPAFEKELPGVASMWANAMTKA